MIQSAFILNEASCMNNCLFCKGHPQGNIKANIEREFAKIKRLIDEGHQIENLDISGNDPGEYLELPALIKNLRALAKPRDIQLSTHGRTLSDEDFVDDLISSGVTTFRIPIYGHCAKVHDALTGSEGSFDDLMLAFRILKNKSARVTLSTMIVKQNQDYLKELFYFVSKMNFASDIVIGLAGYSGDTNSSDEFIPDITKLRKNLGNDLLYLQYKGFPFRCQDIPFCIANVNVPRFNQKVPYMSYIHFNLKEYQKPIYLQKAKSAKCEDCIHDSSCDGFYVTYYESGRFDFIPILHP